MMTKIGQGIGHVNLMCLVEDATSDGMSIKRPSGCHKVVRWPWANGGPRTLEGHNF
jgi:hypothetical protein